MKDIIAQSFGIMGLFIVVGSFQCKKNKNFFLMQGLGSLFFMMNFLLISAYTGAFFNLTNLVRGFLFSKADKKVWKLVMVICLYTACVTFAIYLIWGQWLMIALSIVLYASLIVMSALMWQNDGKYIRYFQVSVQSPVWIVYNCFNFTLGGILCESISMISTVVSFIRYGKDGFEK